MNEYINKSQEYAKWFGDTIGGVREIRLFHILDKKHEEFSAKQKQVQEAYQAYEELLLAEHGMISSVLFGMYKLAVQEHDMEKAHKLAAKQGEAAI